MRLWLLTIIQKSINIFSRVHILANDAIHTNGPIIQPAIHPNTLTAVITNLRRVQITHIAFAALNALSVVEDTLLSHH